MRKELQQYLKLLAGVIVAIAVLLSQAPSFGVKFDGSKAKTEQNAGADTKSEEQPVLTVSVPSLPSTSVLHFTLDSFCLFEIFFSQEDNSPSWEPDLLPVSRFFTTLLSVIISPNAP